MSQDFYQGYALNGVDAKNRVSVPSDFRNVVMSRSGVGEVLVGPGHGDAECLLAYDRSYAAKLMTKFEAQHGASTERAAYDDAAFLFGTAQALKFDDAGRIVLPPVMKELGGIRSHVWCIAGYDWFELWNPWAYLARADVKPAMTRILRAEMRLKGLPEVEPA